LAENAYRVILKLTQTRLFSLAAKSSLKRSYRHRSKSNYVFKRPYGEEIYRATQGTDKVRQKFTSYERDNETDLDFAQARMYQNKLGRFTNPDPLLSSGRIENPQTWNRFSYVLGNPLRYSDPFGLFEWDETLKDDPNQSEAENARRKFHRERILASIASAKQKAQAAFDAGKISQKKLDKINNALNSYGKEGEANGVTIGEKSEVIATRASRGDTLNAQEIQSGSTSVKSVSRVRFDIFAINSDDLDVTIVHEGQHVVDGVEQANLLNEALTNNNGDMGAALKAVSRISQYTSENNAFHTQSYYFQAIGQDDKKWGTWNKGWAKKEETEELNRQKAINKTIKDGYKLSPEVPGGNLVFPCRPCNLR
jgi:RHS repeat-associated protein